MKNLTVRRGSYVDSVALMQVSQRVGRLDGVHAALVAMATQLNVELAEGMGFDVPAGTVPTEMLVALDVADESELDAALAEVDAALTQTTRPSAGGFGSAPPPVTIRAAARDSDATVALISTPGQYAALDAYDAIDAGLHTMLFSDNVSVEHEVALKEYAERAGVLLMGPDCGTAVVGGVGLGFANVVRPGPVGVVAASGTGAQHLMSLLDGAAVGISHCLGVGGRDLSEAVGARSTLQALAALAEDDATELIVVVSKPPAQTVAETVRARAAELGKPVLFGLLGKGQPDLTETARAVVEATGRSWTPPESWPGTVVTARVSARPGGALRGLFAGGTLCDEAMLIAAEALGPIASNIPLQPEWALDAGLSSRGNTMIDFGDDRLTQGRPHPMIDGTIRVERFEAEIDDPATGVVLLDVVLGLGSAADPAGELEASVRRATEAGLPVVVSVIGTRDDPQGLAGTVKRLHDAGAWVHLSNAAAARTAVALVSGGMA